MRSFLVLGIWSNSDGSPISHLEFDLHQVVSGLVEAKPMVMLWESAFIAQEANGELAGGQGPVKHRRIPQSILQSALAATIAFSYSKNIISVVIRMALGASF